MIMKAVYDIIVRAIPGKGYRLEPRSEKACSCIKQACDCSVMDLEFVLDKLREAGLRFGYSR